MKQRILSRQKYSYFAVYFGLLLVLWINEKSVACSQDDLSQSFDDRDSGIFGLETPLRNSGVGDRQSAYRRVLHEHLERLTHAELQAEREREHKQEHEHEHDHEHEHGYDYEPAKKQKDNHEDYTTTEKYKQTKNVRTENNYDDNTDDNDDNEEEREYNPWLDSFNDQYEDGTYVYGYSLPNGVTRYERSFYSEKYKGRVVEGFYTEPRYIHGHRKRYELRCYRADYYGYRPLGVQYLRRPPIVRRDTEPNVDCFDKH